MTTELKVEIVKRETIIPSLSTPNHLKSFRLSVLDQFSAVLHTRVLLFYSKVTTNVTDQNPDLINAGRSKLLKESLTQTLNEFYPFAGRIRENISIDCNDDGAEFVETKVNCHLSTIMDRPDLKSLIQLVPSDILVATEEIGSMPLLLVKANFFECSGMAIGVSVSHKIADAATIGMFLNSWAKNTSESSGDSLISTLFVSPDLFPPHDSLASLAKSSAGQSHPPEKISVRRLVFHGSRISVLRSKLSGQTVENPTRVEAVLALIWKCAMEASQRKSALFQAVNLRKILSFQANISGNISWSYRVKCSETRDAEMQDLVALIRKGIDEFKRSFGSRIGWEGLSSHVEEYLKLIRSDEVDIYMATSWCRFPFYGVDFGWGKPLWVCVPTIRSKNYIVLMDTRDGDGIEVLLSLSEEHMSCFERNQGLLEFASFNPSASFEFSTNAL